VRADEPGTPLPLAVALTVLAALLVSLYPLPVWLLPARPDLLVLVVIFWVMRAPQVFGIGSAWLLGLLMDGLEGGVLGRHALALSVVAYASILLRRRMLHYSLLQQMLVVFALCAMHQILCHWVHNLTGHATSSLVFLMGSLTGAFCWPLFAYGTPRHRSLESWRLSP
jgi:rod shape-determining protein MreD